MTSRKNQPITRRLVLRGLGATLALPWLDAMLPRATSAVLAAGGPKRMAFFYVPNGADMPSWTPEGDGGTRFELPFILEPLQEFRSRLLVLSGLAQDTAFGHGDGPGDHARALACFLTGVHPKKTNGADIKVGISVDQLAAQKIGNATRFPSLELGIEGGAQSGNCDSGYSCAYSSNISWSSPNTPVAKEINPRAVFDRLFGAGRDPSTQRRMEYGKSILDTAGADAKRLHGRLGVADRRKLDEYLGSVREVERRLTAKEPIKPPPGTPRPEGIPETSGEHIRLMGDLLALAFQTDSTRIATFMFANAGSTRAYPEIGIDDGHHDLSHHGKKAEKIEKIKRINRFHVEQLAHFLKRLRGIREGDKALLDKVMVVYGSGIGDGNRHNHDDLPIVLLGGGDGTIKGGRHLKFDKDKKTPLNNLYLSMLDRMGAPVDSLGDSTGRLAGLDG